MIIAHLRNGCKVEPTGFINFDVGDLFALWVSDCYSPPVYLVRATGFQSAFDWFVTEKEKLCIIEPPDLWAGKADYDEDSLYFNDNGNPVDTESINGCEVDRLETVFEPNHYANKAAAYRRWSHLTDTL